MKIDKITNISIKKLNNPSIQSSDFNNIKNKIKEFFLDSKSPLTAIENNLQNISNLSGKELLGLQIRASNYHVKVELATKVAESLISTSRRLQQVQ